MIIFQINFTKMSLMTNANRVQNLTFVLIVIDVTLIDILPKKKII